MAKKPLKILSAGVSGTQPPPAALAAQAAAPHPHLAFEVENPNEKPLHVWASRRAYHYDSATHELTVYLTEQMPEPPPGIRMISDHPRTPVQVEVKGRSRGTIDVEIPHVYRRRIPGTGLGISFVEERITQVDRVTLHVQFAADALRHMAKETPVQRRKRLRAHGDVVRATIDLAPPARP